MAVLRASTRPLIQVKGESALMEPEAPSRKMELPEGQNERVELLMVPDPTAKSLKNERLNSPTRLLAVTWAFRILNMFGRGTTQRKMQESYSVQAKQLVACITGKNTWVALTESENCPEPTKDLQHKKSQLLTKMTLLRCKQVS